MRERLSELKKLSRLELTLSYRFPAIEFLIAILVFSSGLGVLSIGMTSIGMNLDPDPYYNATQTTEHYTEHMMQKKTLAYVYALATCTNVLFFLIPLFVAFTVARPFEDGTLKTILSYPVNRSTLMSVRTLLLLSLTIIPAIALSAVWTSTLIPSDLNIGYAMIASIATLVSILMMYAISQFVAIISKKSSATVIVGMIFWIVVTTLISSPLYPITLVTTLNPVYAVFNFIIGGEYAPTINDLIVGISSALAIALCLLATSLKLFSKVEV